MRWNLTEAFIYHRYAFVIVRYLFYSLHVFFSVLDLHCVSSHWSPSNDLDIWIKECSQRGELKENANTAFIRFTGAHLQRIFAKFNETGSANSDELKIRQLWGFPDQVKVTHQQVVCIDPFFGFSINYYMLQSINCCLCLIFHRQHCRTLQHVRRLLFMCA